MAQRAIPPGQLAFHGSPSQFIDAFDEIFRTERMKVLKTPVRTPVANAFAERWIGTLRREFPEFGDIPQFARRDSPNRIPRLIVGAC